MCVPLSAGHLFFVSLLSGSSSLCVVLHDVFEDASVIDAVRFFLDRDGAAVSVRVASMSTTYHGSLFLQRIGRSRTTTTTTASDDDEIDHPSEGNDASLPEMKEHDAEDDDDDNAVPPWYNRLGDNYDEDDVERVMGC